MSNVRDRDLGSFVAEVRSKLSGELRLPPGYFVEFGGQFENQERATQRLMLVIPVVVGLIFGLLYAMFGSVAQSVLVMMNVPFAFVGGIAALWLRQMNLNLSASIGFIALFGQTDCLSPCSGAAGAFGILGAPVGGNVLVAGPWHQGADVSKNLSFLVGEASTGGFGSFLVRPAPVPATLVLVVIGFVGLMAISRAVGSPGWHGTR